MSLEDTVKILEKYGLFVELRDSTQVNVGKYDNAYYVWPSKNGTLSLRQDKDKKYPRADLHYINNHISIRIDELQTIKLYRKRPELMGLTYETHEVPPTV